MSKKSNYFAALMVVAAIGSAALTACSDSADGPSAAAATDGAIRFAANTDFSRSADITTNNLKAFNVYAYTDGDSAVFMDNVEVTKSGNAWTYSPLKYWPAQKAVDFYAYAPSTWLGTATPLTPVPYEAYPGTEDIVYAVAPNLTGGVSGTNAQVLFNFRHALSKVTVKLSSSDDNLQVRVTNVAMANIATRGNFNFPSGSTAETMTDETVGTWTDQNAPFTYLFYMSQDQGDVITLTTTATDMSNHPLGGPKFLMPQPLTYRSNGSGKDTYLAIMCSVYDAKTGTKLWPNANTPEENVVEGSSNGDGLLKFPLSSSAFSAWKPGYHYIYNVVINANDEMGAIEFGTPTVDTYIDVNTSYQ